MKGKERAKDLGQDKVAVSPNGKERARSAQWGEGSSSHKVGRTAKGKTPKSAPGEWVDGREGGMPLTVHRWKGKIHKHCIPETVRAQ